MENSVEALRRILKDGAVLKEDLGNSLNALRSLRLVKIGRKRVRPRDYLDLVKPDEIRDQRIPYVFKLASRLVRGKRLHDPVMYAQGVLGLRLIRNCSDVEEVAMISKIYAADQMSTNVLNELLLSISTSCSFREGVPKESIRVLETYQDFLTGKAVDRRLLREVPRVHGELYDRLLNYIRKLREAYRTIKDEILEAVVEKKRRTKIDEIRSLLRACAMIEERVKNVETRSSPLPR